MRDLFVSLFVLGLLPSCFRKPFVGLCVFSLLAYMRLQDLSWGFARDIRWSFYVAIVMFAGAFVSTRERTYMARDWRCYVMLLLVALVGVSIVIARTFDPSVVSGFTEFGKIIIISLFTTGLVTSRDRLRLLIWVIALSFGFFGLKSGLQGIASLGQMQILQGPGGMLRDNNDFALALAMGIPMMWHIAASEKRTALRRLFFVLVPLTAITIVMTHSRGGFLALAAAALVLSWRGRNRFASYTSLAAMVLAGLMLAPSSYTDRIISIRDYEQDASSQGRLKAWGIAREMIQERPLFGVGFAGFEREYARFDPEEEGTRSRAPGEVHVAHNSYLQIWAECGTLAFLLYMVLLLGSFWDLRRVRMEAERRYHASWILNYASMFEASMAAFVVGGVFLNRAHFDLFYHWVALIVAFSAIARRHLAEPGRYPTRPGKPGKLVRVSSRGMGVIGTKPRTAFGGSS